MKKILLEPTFSEAIDRICKKCGELNSQCVCKKTSLKILLKNEYKINIVCKKINNHLITHISPLHTDDYENILKYLKKQISCGGSAEIIDDYALLKLQGDCVLKAKNELIKMEFVVK